MTGLRKRGRPKGTLKRDEAVAAAKAIVAGEFRDIRLAARHFRPARIASDEGFRDFVDMVEEALRELASSGRSSFRAYRALAKRSRNRRSQPLERRKRKSVLSLKYQVGKNRVRRLQAELFPTCD